jgi:membrane-bound metal-dependent hydrolase YbcI (DUF457 family)
VRNKSDRVARRRSEIGSPRSPAAGLLTGPSLPGIQPHVRTGAGKLAVQKWSEWVAAWLATRSRNRWRCASLVAAIVLIDLVLLRHPFGFAARALMDEPCHLATAVVVLGAITRLQGRLPRVAFIWAMLIGSVAIDIDHLPGQLAARGMFYGNLPRPYTHALWLLVVLIVIAVAAARRARIPGRARAALVASVFAGATWGIAAHFLRDVATAPISLLWPISGASFQVSYGWYLGALLVICILPLRQGPARTAHERY